MSSIRDLYGDYTTKRTDATTRETARDDAAKALADATAASAAADQAETTSLTTLTAQTPENVPYLFDHVVLINLHGAVQELPLGDPDAAVASPA